MPDIPTEKWLDELFFLNRFRIYHSQTSIMNSTVLLPTDFQHMSGYFCVYAWHLKQQQQTNHLFIVYS